MERGERERTCRGALTGPKGPGPRCLPHDGKVESGAEAGLAQSGGLYSRWCYTACTVGRPRCRRWLQTGRAVRSSALPWGPPGHGCCCFPGRGRDWKLRGSLGHGSTAAGRRRPRRSAVQNGGPRQSGTEACAGEPGGPAGCSRGWDPMPPATWKASASEASAASAWSPSAAAGCTGPYRSHTCQGRWGRGSCS